MMNGQKSRTIKKADYLRFIKAFATVPGLDYFLAACEENRKAFYMQCLVCCTGFVFELDGEPATMQRGCIGCTYKDESEKVSKSFCVGINSNNEIMIYRATGVTCYDFDNEIERGLLAAEIKTHVKTVKNVIHCGKNLYTELYIKRDETNA